MTRREDVEVEHTECGMIIHLPDFNSLRMKETAEFRASIKRPEPGKIECSHWRRGVLLNSEQRTVECRACAAKLDPYDALAQIVKTWDQIRSDFERARVETQDTNLRLEVLLRLEKNARERLKRLGIGKLEGWWQSNVSQILKSIVVDVQREQRKVVAE